MKKPTLLERAFDAIESAYAEFDAAMDTYEDYVPCGKLLDKMEAVMDDLQKAIKEAAE